MKYNDLLTLYSIQIQRYMNIPVTYFRNSLIPMAERSKA